MFGFIACGKLCEIETELRTKLTGGEKKLCLEYVDLWVIISGDIDFNSYKTGFRYSANFALDAFTKTTEENSDSPQAPKPAGCNHFEDN